MSHKSLVGSLHGVLVGVLLICISVQTSVCFADGPQESFASRVAKLRNDLSRLGETGPALGTVATIDALVTDLKRRGDREPKYAKRIIPRIAELLDAAEEGRDLLRERRGMFWRGYESRFTYNPQMYSIYVPKNYEPDTPISLVITLHGGSSNHNVWLALNLGNKVSVADYWDSHRKEFKAKRHPKSIVVAPDGLGQVRWRWAGEQDVLDVIEDVRANYNIDPDKIFISGLSNGAIGAYTIGLKHAHRFAGIFPLAGVTNWLSHHEADGRWRRYERRILKNESALTYAKNAANTFMRFFHGDKDPGFSVEQARAMQEKLKRFGIPYRYHEFHDQGHDLGYVLWRRLIIDGYVERYTRQTAPVEVRLVSASDRARVQHWLTLDDRFDHVRPAQLHGKIVEGYKIEVTTENAERFTVTLDDCPVESPVVMTVDGQEVYNGPIPSDGRLTVSASLVPASSGKKGAPEPLWSEWDGSLPRPGSRKMTGLSGPLGDVGYERQIHVYGTGVPQEVSTLKKAARLGARGWMVAWDYTEIRHRVIPDTELTEEMMDDFAVHLYGDARSNSWLARLGDQLPIKVKERALEVRGKRLAGWQLGARFVCPNPLAPSNYLVVATGVNAEAIERGGRLPLYLGDYIIYNYATVKRKAFMILGGRKEIEAGFFTEDWKLPLKPPVN